MTGRGITSTSYPGSNCPCLTLLPAGVAWPSHYWERRWALNPPFHPCLLRTIRRLALHRRYVSVARSGKSPRPGGYPAPRHLECGLSSTLSHCACAQCIWSRGHPACLWWFHHTIEGLACQTGRGRSKELIDKIVDSTRPALPFQ